MSTVFSGKAFSEVRKCDAHRREVLEREMRALLAEYELDSWVMAGNRKYDAALSRTRIDVPIEWTNLQGSRQWAVHVIHSRFLLGSYEVDVHARPIRLFGYAREDGRFAVVAAISHLFADGAGLKGFARALSSRMEPRTTPVRVAALSDVLAAQDEIRSRQPRQVEFVSDQFATYYETFDWDRLGVRETGELVFRPKDGDILALRRSMTAVGDVLAALGAAWRHCILAASDSKIPMTVLHRHPSPTPARPYMGPGDINVVLDAPDPRTDRAGAGANVWRYLISQTRLLDTDPPPEIGSPRWNLEQDRYSRTLRLNVRANVSELARDPGTSRFIVRSTRTAERKRAFADVAFTRRVLKVRWDIPRTAEAHTHQDTFGQLTLSALLAADGEAKS
ncbi:hypothetical protein ACFVH0_35705 [Streptomyces sp. NPDC127117]|uniref:hypothetical protein n=1 Tax=Streptomyces sp. NPDC127117 TaxID=3345368 RepID=UPI00362F805B